MKKNSPIRRSSRGTVIILALVIVVVGAVVLAGWATMLATRSLFPPALLESQKRRIAKANGRALAREYILSSLPSGIVAATNVALADDWGGFTIDNDNNVNILANSTPPTAYNPFSPAGRKGFEQLIAGSILTADETFTWSFRIRGHSPLFGGYPLVLHRPMDTVSATVDTPEALLWMNADTLDFAHTSYQAASRLSLLPHSGTNLSKFPYVPLAMESPTGVLNYGGEIDVTPLTAAAAEITDDAAIADDGITIVTTGTEQTITLDLDVVNLFTAATVPENALLLYRINTAPGNVPIILNLEGGADETLPPLHIVYETVASDLTTVNLNGVNDRRTYLSIIKDTAVTITSAGATTWRMGLLLQGCPSDWALGGQLTLTGGIRTNANINVSSGTIVLETDTDPGGLDSMADRIVWFEENQQE